MSPALTCLTRRQLAVPWRWRGLLFLSLGLLSTQGAQAQQPVAPAKALPLLTRAQQVRDLTPEQAALGYPVRLEAVVTYYDSEDQDLFVQDSSAGIWVDIGASKVDARPGQLVEVEGVSDFKDFAPQIGKPRLRILGEAKMPEARLASFESMASTREDSQWVEVEGIVHSASSAGGYLSLALLMGDGRLKARIPAFWKAVPSQLVDARIRLRGACGMDFNQRGQLIGVMLYVPSLAYVAVIEPPPADPFSIPLQSIRSLLQFRPEARLGHRVRIQGVVTLTRQGRSLYVEDKTASAYIQTVEPVSAQPGDRVEVLGFPAAGHYTPILLDAMLRTVGRETPPSPVHVTPAEALQGPHDGHLVRLEARLVESMLTPREQLLLLDSGGQFFNAQLEDPRALKKFSAVGAGSRVRVTGICSVQNDEDLQPRAFRILLRSPDDLVLLERAPSWTLRPVLLTLGIMAGLILGALAWVALLRRRVQQQTAVIREWLRREATLKKHYHALFENANDFIYTTDLDGNFTSCNRAGELITGYAREEILKMKASDLLAEEYVSLTRLIRDEKLAGRELTTYEIELVAKDGRQVPVEVSTSLIECDGKVVGVQGAARDITQRRRAEEALQKANEMVRAVIQASPVAIFTLNPDGIVRMWNPSAEQMFGWREDEVLGRPLPTVPEEKQEEFKALRGRTMRGESLCGLELRRKKKDGTGIDVSLSTAPLHDGSGQAVGILGIMADITERKRAEEALREAEQRYRSIFENAAEGIFQSTLDGRYVSANPALARMFGHDSPEELIAGMTDIQNQLYADPQRRAVFKKLLTEQGELREFESQVRQRDGSVIWISENARAVRDTSGNIAFFEGTVEDITERKRAEEAVRQSEKKYRTLFESANDAILIFEPETEIILEANKKACEVYGFPKEELVRMSLKRLTKDQPRGERQIAEILREGKDSNFETVHMNKDGTLIDMLASSSLIDYGERRAILTILRNITERKRAAQALQQAKEAAEAATLAKSQFLANMSHEIRTPLNGIIGMTELALDSNLTLEQREYLMMVKESADSLLTVINDILDFSKIEVGKLAFDFIDFKLRDSLGSTMKALALRAHQKGLELTFRVPPEVPDGLVGDPTRLRQILLNLVGNAIKFTEQGEVILRVELLSQTEEEARLHFAVTDTGIGIPAEKQQTIFKAFAQVDGSTTRKYGGTGLGLAISSQLVEAMGGRIWVESAPGLGSTFHFTTPFGLTKGDSALAVPCAAVELRGMPVLAVDDSATNLRILEEILLHWQMKPTLANGGRTALSAMERALDADKSFPLVLIDAQMPDMDGFTLAQHVRENPRLAGATIMMLTSAGQPGDAAHCRELGIAAYLVKPIKQSELLDAILIALSKTPAATARPTLVTRHTLREARRKLRILLVEDNVVNQELVSRLVQKWGHEVVVAHSGREALAALQESRHGEFDAALMDVQMPEMDGLEATKLIREKEKTTGAHLPIIAMTAHAMKGDRERCLAAGMDQYISKPIQRDELFAAIERLHPTAQVISLPTAPGNESSKTMDLPAALARVDGSMELLQELAALFCVDSSQLLSKLRAAIERQDAQAVESTAHALKGAVGNFGAMPAFEAAQRLEAMGREGNLSEARTGLLILEEELLRLESALADLRGKEVKVY